MKNPLLYSTRRSVRGFTLVELMIVIAIMTLLTAIIMVDFVQTRGSARDGKRVSDLAQIQLTLEQYFDRCGQYPLTLALTANNGCPTGSSINLGSFISKIPVPPGSTLAQTSYDYTPMDPAAPTGAVNPVNYVLHVTLEYPSPTVANGISESLRQTIMSGYNGPGFSGPGAPAWSVHNVCYDPTNSPNDYCLGPK